MTSTTPCRDLATRTRRQRSAISRRATGCSRCRRSLVVAAVIVFPWLFTLYMSAHDWKIGGGPDLRRPRTISRELFTRSRASSNRSGTPLYFTVLAVVLPILFGTAAALVFHREFPVRGLLRAHLHHADDGDAGRGRAGLDDDVPPAARRAELPALAASASGRSSGSTSPSTVIPTLVLVEVWHWTPLVMLIVLGGLASAADASPTNRPDRRRQRAGRCFRHITLPLVLALHHGRAR